MAFRCLPTIALVMLMALGSNSAAQGIPDLTPSYATVTPEGRSVLISPSGQAPTLSSQGVTIDVVVLDFLEQPIPGFPFQDVWLDGFDPAEIALCQGGSVADANTDIDGHTTIAGTIAGGGWTSLGVQVMLSGVPLDQPALDLQMNSPDLNGDLVVDLADLGSFAQDYLGTVYRFRSDLNHDGGIDLRDLGEFAAYFRDECP